MDCQTCRDAVSARFDHEDVGLPSDAVDAHLETCAACQAFAAGTARLRRSVSVRSAEDVPDLTGAVLARVAAARRPKRVRRAPVGAHWTRWALLGVALVLLVLAAPGTVLGSDASHAGRELDAWYLALAAALGVVTFRPERAAGLLPFAATLAAVMTGTAVLDIAAGRTLLIDETQHLLEIAAVALLWRIARHPGDREPLLGGLRRTIGFAS
jgi:predicted anti-sigma-YlaC factor YlaD